MRPLSGTPGQPRSPGAGARLLVVEDDTRLALLLEEQLRLAGHGVHLAPDLGSARELLAEHDFDLVILDRNLPDGDGLELAEELARDERSRDSVAVLMLTARADVDSRVAGLYAGASDYLTKPFSVQELLARIHVRLRERGGAEILRYEKLELDPANSSCRVGDQVVLLPEREFAVLHLLLKYRGRLITQDDLERSLYGGDLPESNTVEVFVHNLRRRLKELGLENVIRTVRNRGYIIV
ncbi:MAG TPA: response regulator transcription factor [Trueperaceae bacterium]|nr:response regulator transcription factor [Trueperaceae bacterium]